MINAILVDDEEDARFMLRTLLERHFQNRVRIIAEADDVDTGVEAVNKHRPDLVFLDIKMPQGTGFDVLKKLDSTDFEVIFVTAYDQFAIKAFQFSAIGYLMKPIKIAELKKTIENVQLKKQKNKSNTSSKLKVLVENYGDDKQIKKLVISSMNGYKVLSIEEIVRIEGDGNYSNFVVKNEKKITSSKTLGEYENLLKDFGFFRIHQSTIINLRHVKGFSRGDQSEVEMSDGKYCSISRHRKTAFVKCFI